MGAKTATPAAIEYIEAATVATPVVELTVAADVGNARTDILVQIGDGGGRPILIEMPTVRSLEVVNSRQVFDRRGLAPGDWAGLGDGDHVLNFDGIERYVGQIAVDFARAQSSGRGSDRRYSDGTTAEFILAGIARALPKGAADVVVRCATLLPIKLWPAHAGAVERALRTTVSYGYNGRQVRARFEYAKALREGEAAYHALDKKPAGRAVIVDIGGRTVNVALFSDGVYQDGDTIDNMGIEAALDALDRQLEAEALRRLTFAERLELQAAMRDGQSYTISHRQVAHRIDGKARKIFDATAGTLNQELARLFTMEDAESGALIGGGAFPTFFGDVLNREYRVLDLVNEPETRNVYGAFAQLVGQPVKKARKQR
jgi:hypothetical protein